ncbi:conserved exported hypothetical protein [uncultured Eubacteriales bacterium]|uniref:DUF4097 domain-containing protein n=1 Tax=uncultured Eubacteriales bacterium TaxID=172733 RepID=A0A212K0P9_9FIRM|nr:conserved exported hypothetical protein [uncultured Eubacteriales bacterium]
MKGLTKLLLTTAAALFGVGVVLALAGWLMGGQTSMVVTVGGRDVNVGLTGVRLSNWSGERNRVADGGDLEPFTALDVDVDLGDVYFIPSNHYGVELSWQGEDYALHYSNKNGKLKVWSTSSVRLGVDLGFGYGAEVRVYFPEGAEFESVTVKTSLGSAELEGLRAGRLDLEADLGSVAVTDAVVGESTMNLSLGDLELKRITARTLDLTLSLGALVGDEVSTSESLTVENDMGSVVLAGAFEGHTKIVDDMGSVELTVAGAEADYGYDLRTSMGNVTINGKDAGDEADHRGGTHTIEVENSMGDIEIKFEK